jgi:hypothetical protein
VQAGSTWPREPPKVIETHKNPSSEPKWTSRGANEAEGPEKVQVNTLPVKQSGKSSEGPREEQFER